ncbi:MAG: hypothetical protein PHC45_03870 [Clostridiaceae bacterium]|nr:hypothetical protein [Clostridiaceae bacterium]
MEGGSNVIVNFSKKLNTVKYSELSDVDYFESAATDGDFVSWGGGRLRIIILQLKMAKLFILQFL